jgi:hypothetical protein
LGWADLSALEILGVEEVWEIERIAREFVTR